MRNWKTITLSALVLTLSSTHRGASAQPPPSDEARERFGHKSQLAISSDASLTIQRRTQSNGGGAVTTVTLAPAADFFVYKNVSVGGFVSVEYTKAGGSHSNRFGIGPRVGYNVWLLRRLSIWPRLGFSYAHTKSPADVKGNAIALNLFAPFVFHPVEHFFAGFGPFVDTDLNGDHRATVWGAKLTVGGWM